jgi:periplasmic divalent cation tolerance protein
MVFNVNSPLRRLHIPTGSEKIKLLFAKMLALMKAFLPPKHPAYSEEKKILDLTYLIVLVTTASKEEAERIAQNLLDAKLIACANIIGPVTSLFRWSEKLERAEEYAILMKSRTNLFEKVSEAVKARHSYKVPEVLALKVANGSKAYLEWLESCLK